MSYCLYCFEYTVPNSFTKIYKVSTTTLTIQEVLTPEYKLEFCAYLEDIDDLQIYEKLYNYKYKNMENHYKVDLNRIKTCFRNELLDIEFKKVKVCHINRFLKLYIEKINASQETTSESSILRSYDLYKIYNKWCNKEMIANKEKAGICEFVNLCQKYTFMGKCNMYHEWETFKLKKL
jgi:hypothetical protein